MTNIKEDLAKATLLGAALIPAAPLLFPVMKYGVLSSRGDVTNREVFVAIGKSPLNGVVPMAKRLALCNAARLGGLFTAQDAGASDNVAIVSGASAEGFGLAPFEAKEIRSAMGYAKAPTIRNILNVGALSTIRGIAPLYAVKNAVQDDGESKSWLEKVKKDFTCGAKAGLLSSPMQKLVINSASSTSPLLVITMAAKEFIKLANNPKDALKSAGGFARMAGARALIVGSVAAIGGISSAAINETWAEKVNVNNNRSR